MFRLLYWPLLKSLCAGDAPEKLFARDRNLHYIFHLFLLCKNLEICQWVSNFNKQTPEDVATHYLRAPNPCKYEYAELSRPGNALLFFISLKLIPLLTKIVLKAS